MIEHGLPVDKALVAEGDFTFEAGRQAGATLLSAKDRPTAIFASNDDMALGVLNLAAASGLIVPDDVAVCGFDDTPSTMLSTPPLTTIRQPVTEMAAAATRLLLPATRGQPGQAEKVDYTLIERLSTQSSG